MRPVNALPGSQFHEYSELTNEEVADGRAAIEAAVEAQSPCDLPAAFHVDALMCKLGWATVNGTRTLVLKWPTPPAGVDSVCAPIADAVAYLLNSNADEHLIKQVELAALEAAR
jgi:hypothetical protein